jgi:hypothetical protein
LLEGRFEIEAEVGREGGREGGGTVAEKRTEVRLAAGGEKREAKAWGRVGEEGREGGRKGGGGE